MSKKTEHFLILCVKVLSESLGSSFPEGWLCAIIMLVALHFKATAKSSLTSTTVPVIPPLDKG